jgi:hypothetical protein
LTRRRRQVDTRADTRGDTSGATASGDGVNLDNLIDDTEATNWASLSGPVLGKQVTVRLDPSLATHQVRRVQVSAMLRVNIADANDPGGQNRFNSTDCDENTLPGFNVNGTRVRVAELQVFSQ